MTYTGELPTPDAEVIWRTPVRKMAVLAHLVLTNTSPVDRLVTVWLDTPAGDIAISPVDVNLPTGALYEDIKVRRLGYGQNLKAVADGDAVVYALEIDLGPVQS